MPQSHIDHITLAAYSLSAGVDYLQSVLGVRLQPGGKHPRMGTHNSLLRLGDQVFLEVIAIDPDAPAPNRPRWFGLDQLDEFRQPFALTWVARTDDIHMSVKTSTEAHGSVEPMSRAHLSWHMTIPEDGRLILQGLVPALIQWEGSAHPCALLPDQGCSLISLEACSSSTERLHQMSQAIGLSGAFSVSSLPAGESPRLVARIMTPQGMRELRLPILASSKNRSR